MDPDRGTAKDLLAEIGEDARQALEAPGPSATPDGIERARKLPGVSAQVLDVAVQSIIAAL